MPCSHLATGCRMDRADAKRKRASPRRLEWTRCGGDEAPKQLRLHLARLHKAPSAILSAPSHVDRVSLRPGGLCARAPGDGGARRRRKAVAAGRLHHLAAELENQLSSSSNRARQIVNVSFYPPTPQHDTSPHLTTSRQLHCLLLY